MAQLHESLLARHAILLELKAAALWSNFCFYNERRTGKRKPQISRAATDTFLTQRGASVLSSRDMEHLLSLRSRLVNRWRKAERRKAVRRGLRTLLSVYCPDLLAEFEQVLEERERVVRTRPRQAARDQDRQRRRRWQASVMRAGERRSPLRAVACGASAGIGIRVVRHSRP